MNLARSHLHGVLVLVALLVASCNADVVNVGIDGTGVAGGRAIISVGSVRKLGSIEVNGLSYDTNGAAISIDDGVGTAADLNVGDVVIVEGRLNTGEGNAVAQRVTVDHVLQGRVEAIDVANRSLVALGQTIQLAADTSFSTSLANGLAALSVGDAINVSGFRKLRGAIEARRIDRQAGAAALKTTGAVTEISADGRHLSINGLVVDYGAAQLLPANARDLLARGVFVVVKGSAPVAGGPLVATSVQVKSDRLTGAADRIAHVEGYLTALDAADARRFEVNGFSVSTTGSTTFDGTLSADAPLAVKGAVDTVGSVVASNVQTGFVIPSGPKFSGQGRVFDALNGPVAGAEVYIWVQTPTVGYSYTWAVGGITSMSDGKFATGSLDAGALLLVNAHKPGFVQPCALLVDSSKGIVNLDVELVAESTLDSFNPPLPLSATGAISVSGTIYETTIAGRQPISGARLWFGDSMGLTYATTLSDRNGHYFACNLPNNPAWTWGRELWAQKPGYSDAIIEPLDTSHSNVLDVEMKRN